MVSGGVEPRGRRAWGDIMPSMLMGPVRAPNPTSSVPESRCAATRSSGEGDGEGWGRGGSWGEARVSWEGGWKLG